MTTKKTTKKRDEGRYRNVRMTPDSYKRLEDLLAMVAKAGWAAVGSARSDRVTYTAVVGEAIDQLMDRAKKR